MIKDQNVSSYETARYGAWDHIALRWKMVVNTLDSFVPDWASREGRETSGNLGSRAADAIYKLTVERLRQPLAEQQTVEQGLAEQERRTRYGAQDLAQDTRRVQRVVDTLDRLVPDWFRGRLGPRADSNHMGSEMAAAIERLVKERDYFKAGFNSAVDEKAHLLGQLAQSKEDKNVLTRRIDELEARRPTTHNPAFSAPYRGPLGMKYEVIYHPCTKTRKPYVCHVDEVAEYADGRVRLHVRWTGDMPLNSAAGAPHADAPVQRRDGSAEYSEWRSSYTKRVVDALEKAIDETPSITFGSRVFQTASDAIKLLQDYHHTQHEVYEGRDEARAARDTARAAHDAACKEVEQLTHALDVKSTLLTIARDGRFSAIKERQALHEKLRRVRELLDSTESAS